MARIVVVDDEITMVQMVSELFRGAGHEVHPFTNGSAALEALEGEQPDLVITDLNLDRSRSQGVDILQKARSLHPPPPVVVVTAFGSIESAVEAMRKGAYDYLTKPFKLADLQLCVQRALTYRDTVSENVYLRRQLQDRYGLKQIVGASPKMDEVFRLIKRVADTDSTVLILGESGTGKELVARALHFNGRRQGAGFVPVNCSALPENLLESELFGHRKGAFTGAISDKRGLFEEADGGTIFLDEIGCMPPVLQSRLLRVLQDREIRRVGDNTPVHVNVRVLAATNAPLENKVKDGTFREDLYYRLNVIPITLPSLRERKDDVPLLVAHFLQKKLNASTGQPFQVSGHAMSALCVYDWPGNVRELENAIERACVLCEGNMIRLADLPPPVRAAGPPTPEPGRTDDTAYPLNVPVEVPLRTTSTSPDQGGAVRALKDYLREQEVAYLNRALAQAGGDKEKAANALGISLATLYRKLAGEEGS